jgi:hypothetical protein
MTNQGNPGENAVAERINGTIKEEFKAGLFSLLSKPKLP